MQFRQEITTADDSRDEYLREIALEKAICAHGGTTSEQIVEIARKYLAFLNGEDE